MSKYETVSSVPAFPNIGQKKRKSLAETVREMIISERLRQAAEQEGFESFEEADDFEVNDDYDPASEYEFEEDFEPEVSGDTRLDQQLVSALKRVLTDRQDNGSGDATEAPGQENGGDATPPPVPKA